MFAVRADRLFDGHEMVEDPIVAVAGTTVVAIGRDVPSGVPVEHLGDVTLMPGLIDCHQHLCFDGDGSLEDQIVDVSDDDLAERARANARRAVRAGITTIRDLGDRGFVTLGLRSESGLPTILAAGPPLTPPGGHCWFLGGECDGPAALVKAIHERKRRGCDLVKVMVTGGALTPTYPVWESQFGGDAVATAVAVAHEVGLPVAAHCHGIEGTAFAVAAGVDTIEHCTFLTHTGRSEPDPTVIAAIARSGIPVSATLGRVPSHVAPAIIENNLSRMLDGLRDLHARGGVVVVGTDAGINQGKPHDVLPHAVEPLAEIGIAGLDVLRTLTSTAAEACGMGHRKGWLRPGFDADIVAVPGDPVTRPEALRSVALVWALGDPVDLRVS